jgi:serine/threonine-protein kinase RsbW
MTQFELKEQLSTDLKNIAPLIIRVAEAVSELSGSQDEAFKVKLAVEEAVSNAMLHGNSLDRAKAVEVCVRANDREIFIDVHDEGAGFDYERVPDPTSGERLNHPSGRGIYLMRNLMDEVQFYDAGRGVKLMKRYSRRP